MREQPLLVGVVGFAIGAIIAAVLPRSHRENEFMGEASDALKSQALHTAQEQYGRAREAGGRVFAKARAEAEQQGLTPTAAENIVHDVGEKVSAVVTAAKQGADQELQPASGRAETPTDTEGDTSREQHRSRSDADLIHGERHARIVAGKEARAVATAPLSGGHGEVERAKAVEPTR